MISVVVPVHDEQQSVALLYEELEAASSRSASLGGGLRRRRLRGRNVAALTRLHARDDEREGRPSAPQLRQVGGARGRIRPGARERRWSRSTATSRTTRPRSRACWRSSRRASTSSPAGRRAGAIRWRRRFLSRIFNAVTGRDLRAAPARHELRPEGVPRRGRPRPPALRRAAPVHPGARPLPRLPRGGAAGEPPAARRTAAPATGSSATCAGSSTC